MTQQVAYFPLGGGLDLATPAIAAKPGTARAALNYESDLSGYRRMFGYERFDGQTSPTDAYNAEPDPVQAALDMDAARAAITEVPGSGPVRGVWYYAGSLYAFRDNAGATAGAMHKSSAAGWVPVDLGFSLSFTSGGTYEIAEGNTITGATSGATAVITRIVLTSGTWSAGDAAGYLVMTSATGTFQAENLNVGANLNVATIAGDKSAVTLPPGGSYQFVNYNFYGGSGTLRMYGVNGVGKGFEFDGTVFVPITVTGIAADTPTYIAAHKKHLFFAYPGGQLQHSSLGNPLAWSAVTGSALLAVGDEITGFQNAAPTSLIVMAKNSISVLYGNDASDWQLETLTNEAGALANTAQKMGPVIYMDNRGIRSIGTTSAYGDFTLGTMTQMIAPLLRAKINNSDLPVACVRVRTRDLYRVFFSSGEGISVYLGKKTPEVMPIDLAVSITCACSAETDNRVEKIWFGSANGFVYQMDKGRSYDGEALSYHLRLPFNHHGAPHTRKRWHKAIVEYDAQSNATLTLTGEVDYADPEEPSLAVQNVGFAGGGGFWDAVNWDEFFWSAPVDGKEKVYIDGIGESMSLLLGGEAQDEEPHTLQGLTLFYTVRGIVR